MWLKLHVCLCVCVFTFGPSSLSVCLRRHSRIICRTGIFVLPFLVNVSVSIGSCHNPEQVLGLNILKPSITILIKNLYIVKDLMLRSLSTTWITCPLTSHTVGKCKNVYERTSECPLPHKYLYWSEFRHEEKCLKICNTFTRSWMEFDT